jgi:hypothetical protein
LGELIVLKMDYVSRRKNIGEPMITDSNQARFVRISVCGLQEGSGTFPETLSNLDYGKISRPPQR